MGGLIPIALFNSVGLLVQMLGNISLGLNAILLGAIMVFPKLWDAVADPLIGHLSDNTRTRWGRRRPFILVGGIAVALSFVAIWWVPRGDWIRNFLGTEDAYQWFLLAYLLGALLLFYTAVSIFEITHGALGMEMSDDYHERTRLFSAKSFLGNIFAMAAASMFALANMDFFRGTGGDTIDGMRYVSVFVAALLIPMSIWWFAALREPAFSAVKHQRKSAFWDDMHKTVNNRSFLILVTIIFTLAMGFNFVQIFNNYITIFYLFGGDERAASLLMWWNGLVWGVIGVLAVFPLNWLSNRLGKNTTLLIAILLMCAAQLSKVFCYNPEYPFLIFIPTALLSAGMLMFFTLGSSMVGDVADEDELKTGLRSEGSFCSVYWFVIQVGTTFASFVMGALLFFTAFDENQNDTVEAMRGSLERIIEEAGASSTPTAAFQSTPALNKQFDALVEKSNKLRLHFAERMESHPDHAEHLGGLVERNDTVRADAEALHAKTQSGNAAARDIVRSAEAFLKQMPLLKQQSPTTLLRLRVVEITVPLALSVVSILLTLRYPLTEARCYEIKEALKKRRAGRAS
jgi:GPH family glycoside/pentoside/hexuronide:cation symporter